MAAKSKEEIYFSVCNTILKYELNKGHLAWTLSDISRDSGVTRSLIYYYFGKEKQIILEEAYKFIIMTFFNPSRENSVGIRERIKQLLVDLKAMPYLFVLYYLQKNQDTYFGRMIRQSEELLLKSFKVDYPELTEAQVMEIYLMELGAIAFHLSQEMADEIFGAYERKHPGPRLKT